MKQVLLLVGVFLSLLTTSLAQAQFGVKLGLYLGEVKGGYEETFPDLAVGGEKASVFRQPQLGVWWYTPFSEKLGLQAELLWVHKVWQFDEQLYILEGMIFDYLSLPVAATYRFKNWQFTAGPEVNFLLDQRFIKPILGFNEEGAFSEDFALGLGLNFGVQYHVKEWIIGLRASRDLTTFEELRFTDLNGEPIEGGKYYHQGLTLWAGHQLRSR
ncbi:MAG: outer membrane beta-barrel protein [Lewinella sp.]|jgi:hypothetical protein|uniref:outer membrane beta-barrel protein n=1 Tax=Lewinella sp. TaxID=2004506 RepID=UPI003D6BF78B